jgi:PilZ domain.
MLKVGKEIEIEIKRGNHQEYCRTKIMDLDEEGVYIEYPVNIETEKLVYLANGDQLQVTFFAEDQKMYQFLTTVIGRVREPIPLLRLLPPKPEDYRQMQRRRFVRVQRAVDVSVHPKFDEFSPFVSLTTDVSAGGASIIAPNPIEFHRNQVVIVWLVLPRLNGQNNYFCFNSRVIRTVREGRRQILSVEFLNKSDRDEQLLLQFCYESQLLEKQKIYK